MSFAFENRISSEERIASDDVDALKKKHEMARVSNKAKQQFSKAKHVPDCN
jgi:hypothetical protein